MGSLPSLPAATLELCREQAALHGGQTAWRWQCPSLKEKQQPGLVLRSCCYVLRCSDSVLWRLWQYFCCPLSAVCTVSACLILPAGFPEDSLFYGRDISERVHVRWGTFALVEATRALLRASLEDPLNQKFVLLSEAGIPLYPPDLVYVQLMSEDKSRINSCIVPGVRPHWLCPFQLSKIAALAACFST